MAESLVGREQHDSLIVATDQLLNNSDSLFHSLRREAEVQERPPLEAIR